MEKTEPSLVPEWLKISGSSGRNIAHSEDHGPSRLTRNRSFVNNNNNNNNDHDFGRSFSDRTTSSYFLRSSNTNGSGNLRSRASSGRNHHDREWDNNRYESNHRDKSFLGDRWRRDEISDSPENTSLHKSDRDGLRRSQSMIAGKRGDTWHKKVTYDIDDYGVKSKNGSPSKSKSPIGGAQTNFEREFPSLVSEERPSSSDVRRVPSPGLSSPLQSLPVGSISSPIRGEKWTSALAEVPGLVGSNGMSVSSSSSSQHVSTGTGTGLKMTEAVAQVPSHAQIAPQRSEDLAIKQSRQLIPVTPVLPKALTKVVQQPSSLPHSQRGGPVKGEVSKPKLHILKPVREKNGVAPISKDKLSPTSSNKPVTSMLAPSSSVSGAPSLEGPPDNAISLDKPVMAVLEKRPTPQARSRNDFFNSVRKKSMANITSSSSNSLSVVDIVAVESPTLHEKTPDSVLSPNIADDASVHVGSSMDHDSEAKGHDFNYNGDTNKHLSNGNEQSSSDIIVPDDEEAAFLRSLGWEEDSDEGGLTEEEINAFFKDAAKYVDSKPALKILLDLQPKIPFNSHVGIDGISSGLSPSNGKLES